MFQFFGLEYGVNGYKAVTQGHFFPFLKKEQRCGVEAGRNKLGKGSSRQIWPSTVFGSGLLEAAGALEWDGT